MEHSQLDLAAELARRDLSACELARQAGVSRQAVSRIVHKRSQGHPATRRRLRQVLALYPTVAEELR